MVRYLQAAGVGHVFGYPGDPNVEFMEAAHRAGMQFVLGRRGGTAGLMAEAYGFLRSIAIHGAILSPGPG